MSKEWVESEGQEFPIIGECPKCKYDMVRDIGELAWCPRCLSVFEKKLVR